MTILLPYFHPYVIFTKLRFHSNENQNLKLAFFRTFPIWILRNARYIFCATHFGKRLNLLHSAHTTFLCCISRFSEIEKGTNFKCKHYKTHGAKILSEPCLLFKSDCVSSIIPSLSSQYRLESFVSIQNLYICLWTLLPYERKIGNLHDSEAALCCITYLWAHDSLWAAKIPERWNSVSYWPLPEIGAADELNEWQNLSLNILLPRLVALLKMQILFAETPVKSVPRSQSHYYIIKRAARACCVHYTSFLIALASISVSINKLSQRVERRQLHSRQRKQRPSSIQYLTITYILCSW